MRTRMIRKLLLFIGEGERTDTEAQSHMEISESQLMNILTQKHYKELFRVSYQPSRSLISLTELGRNALADVKQELRDEKRARLYELRGWMTTAIALAAFLKAFFFS